MTQFRKKPVVIEAMQWTGKNVAQILFWMGQYDKRQASKSGYIDDDGYLKIRTLEGEHLANDGDWIIKGVHDEFYPCKPDIFEKTYEPASTPSPDVEAMAEAYADSITSEKDTWDILYDAFIKGHPSSQPQDAAQVQEVDTKTATVAVVLYEVLKKEIAAKDEEIKRLRAQLDMFGTPGTKNKGGKP